MEDEMDTFWSGRFNVIPRFFFSPPPRDKHRQTTTVPDCTSASPICRLLWHSSTSVLSLCPLHFRVYILLLFLAPQIISVYSVFLKRRLPHDASRRHSLSLSLSLSLAFPYSLWLPLLPNGIDTLESNMLLAHAKTQLYRVYDSTYIEMYIILVWHL